MGRYNTVLKELYENYLPANRPSAYRCITLDPVGFTIHARVDIHWFHEDKTLIYLPFHYERYSIWILNPS